MRENKLEWAHLNMVEKRVMERLLDGNIVHGVHFVPINEQRLEIYVFFNRDEDIAKCEESGVTQTIKDYFNEELNRVNRGSAAGVKVRFEFDSHENVVQNFRGNYFLRLR